MLITQILLPVFVLVGLTLVLLLGVSRGAPVAGDAGRRDVALGEAFHLDVLFYVLVALALPLRRADLIVVMLSWIYVVTRFAGVFMPAGDRASRPVATLASVLVLFAMWLYFALKQLLLF